MTYEDVKIDWESFKNDVSLKQMIQSLDKGIKRRMRLIVKENKTENEQV